MRFGKRQSGQPRLNRPGLVTAPARVTETHISTLFFVGERVYKMRKPVQFGFLDFRRRIDRRTDCEREVTLNRRLAPDVYIGVADLVLEGVPIDHMVVMRRMPETRCLAFLARQGAVLDPWLRQVAEALVSFHKVAERSPEISAGATGDALRRIWQDSFTETSSYVGTVLDGTREADIRRLVGRWLDGRGPLLDARIASGRVCDGHGDLQAEDIFCVDDGVRILDCIEFSDTLRHCDVCADVTFLVMDLERLGRVEAAIRLLSDYQELADDRFPPTLVHHYLACHAYVRAKVACLRSAQGADGAGAEAKGLQTLALDHLRRARVKLVLVGGLPGCGKSTLAAGIAAATGLKLLRSDALRQGVSQPAAEAITIAGGISGYCEGRYHPTVTAIVYEELLRRAEHSLRLGESVVLDASWIAAPWREAARSVADRTSSDLIELRCHANPDDAAARIARRLSEHVDLSEATPEVGVAMARTMDPWPSATVIDTSISEPKEAVSQALGALERPVGMTSG
jgi:uncharacterized protein